MKTVRGFARTKSKSVVSMDATAYEVLKRERRRKRETDGLRGEIDRLKEKVADLSKLVEKLIGGRAT